MKKILLSLIILMSFLYAELPATLKGGYPACISEEYFEQFIDASVHKDIKMIKYLANMGVCVITKSGLKVTVLDTSAFSGKAKIRVWLNNQPIILWTNLENVILKK